MCTVTFVPVKGHRYFTSNRDESSERTKAAPPAFHVVRGQKMLFPKDGKAAGTWIAAREDGTVAVLLNGAFENHLRRPPYRQSRGTIMLNIIASLKPLSEFLLFDLNAIEPFTLIIYQAGILAECRWDSLNKHVRILDPEKPYIWSSATLYERTIREKREQWFQQWLKSNSSPTLEDIRDFHLRAGDGDPNNDLKINRDNQLLTVSVTSLCHSARDIRMTYLDLFENKISDTTIKRQ